jgi:hypothetical protein
MTMTKRQRWVLALTSTASLMMLLDGLVVTTALHTIALDLHASIAARRGRSLGRWLLFWLLVWLLNFATSVITVLPLCYHGCHGSAEEALDLDAPRP